MKRLTVIVLSLLVAACDNTGYRFPGRGRVSDAQVSLNASGQHFIISDTAGGEAMPPTMRASYYPFDSTLRFVGTTDGCRLTWIIHGMLQPETVTLDQSAHSNFVWGWDTVALLPVLHGNASIELFPDDSTNGSWTTDSVHVGVLHITRIDSSLNLMDGDFRFTGVDTSKQSTSRDTIAVAGGNIRQLRIERGSR